MKKWILLLGLVVLVGIQSGCTTTPGSELLVPQGNEDHMVTMGAQFD